MNCDQAFERLTDTQGGADAELALHLRDCPRCRAMQHTLSPALDWLRSSADHTVTDHDRPWRDTGAGLLTEESVAVAMEAARRLPRAGHRSAMHQALGLALVALFGIAFGVLVFGQRKDTPPKPAASVASPTSAMCLWIRRDGETPTASAASVVDSCIACHVPTMMRN